MEIVFLIVLAVAAPRITRYIMMKRYFASPEFLAHKQEVADVVSEHNEISDYVNEIRKSGKFSIGVSSTGKHSHLASSINTSNHNYKRDRNVADFSSANVHNASLQVVQKASAEPIKYLIKYFGIEADEESVSEIEQLGESVSKLENAIENLSLREESISDAIAPPSFILKHYLDEFQSQIGLSIPPLEIPYPTYRFQYVSSGGNSSQVTEIKLNSPTIDALIESLSEKVKFKKSAAGQRALMTAKFRDYIKTRDKFTCLICSISVEDEAHLLLEVDHIHPVSKGGTSIESNLQTLCWKCNRTKSNKTPM
jgi:hypothetical protein